MFLKGYICPLLFHILQLNLKSYIDLLLIWGPIYPQKIILPIIYTKVHEVFNVAQSTILTFTNKGTYFNIVQLTMLTSADKGEYVRGYYE